MKILTNTKKLENSFDALADLYTANLENFYFSYLSQSFKSLKGNKVKPAPTKTLERQITGLFNLLWQESLSMGLDDAERM